MIMQPLKKLVASPLPVSAGTVVLEVVNFPEAMIFMGIKDSGNLFIALFLLKECHNKLSGLPPHARHRLRLPLSEVCKTGDRQEPLENIPVLSSNVCRFCYCLP